MTTQEQVQAAKSFADSYALKRPRSYFSRDLRIEPHTAELSIVTLRLCETFWDIGPSTTVCVFTVYPNGKTSKQWYHPYKEDCE